MARVLGDIGKSSSIMVDMNGFLGNVGKGDQING